jgi:hypothetical protein
MADASAQLRAIKASLTAAGNGGAMKYVARAIRAGAKPLAGDVKNAAAAQLPHRGGLAARVAAERVTISVRTGAKTAGVRIIQRKHDAYTTNSGYVRHPVFGTWRAGTPSQKTPRSVGWWSRTLRDKSEEITPRIVEAMNQTAAEIERGTFA